MRVYIRCLSSDIAIYELCIAVASVWITTSVCIYIACVCLCIMFARKCLPDSYVACRRGLTADVR